MNLSKRVMSAALAACLTFFMIYTAMGAGNAGEEAEGLPEGVLSPKESLILWYPDEALTAYVNSVALDYQEKTGVKVTPVLTSGVEYLESINHASVYSDEGPDLYITSNDNLEKAYLAGLAADIRDTEKICNSEHYPKTALNAVTYMDRKIGYPLYYETSFLLYNKTYMEDLVKARLEEEANAAEGQMAMEIIESAESEEAAASAVTAAEPEAGTAALESMGEGKSDGDFQEVTAGAESALSMEGEGNRVVEARLLSAIPSTIDDILTFADNYDAPEAVEAVFKWDVSDIFYNYFFVGNYISAGGEAGDDPQRIDLYNEKAIECLRVYQQLNQFFSIDTDVVNYDSILSDFLEGKIVFTVATTDAVGKLEEARKAGEFDFEYGVAVIPDLSPSLQSRGLSVTNAVVINGYSEKKEEANRFAACLAYDNAEHLYPRAGKVSAAYGVDYEYPEIGNTMEEYEKSVPIPKMLEASNLWVQMEILFTDVWKGADPDEELKALSSQIGSQIDEEQVENVKKGATPFKNAGVTADMP